MKRTTVTHYWVHMTLMSDDIENVYSSKMKVSQHPLLAV